MKKVMLVLLAGMFSVSMFAQTQEKTKPVEKKKEPAKTEAAKPATKETAKPASKETAKPASKDAAKPAAQPDQKKDDLKPKK